MRIATLEYPEQLNGIEDVDFRGIFNFAHTIVNIDSTGTGLRSDVYLYCPIYLNYFTLALEKRLFATLNYTESDLQAFGEDNQNIYFRINYLKLGLFNFGLGSNVLNKKASVYESDTDYFYRNYIDNNKLANYDRDINIMYSIFNYFNIPINRTGNSLAFLYKEHDFWYIVIPSSKYDEFPNDIYDSIGNWQQVYFDDISLLAEGVPILQCYKSLIPVNLYNQFNLNSPSYLSNVFYVIDDYEVIPASDNIQQHTGQGTITSYRPPRAPKNWLHHQAQKYLPERLRGIQPHSLDDTWESELNVLQNEGYQIKLISKDVNFPNFESTGTCGVFEVYYIVYFPQLAPPELHAYTEYFAHLRQYETNIIDDELYTVAFEHFGWFGCYSRTLGNDFQSVFTKEALACYGDNLERWDSIPVFNFFGDILDENNYEEPTLNDVYEAIEFDPIIQPSTIEERTRIASAILIGTIDNQNMNILTSRLLRTGFTRNHPQAYEWIDVKLDERTGDYIVTVTTYDQFGEPYNEVFVFDASTLELQGQSRSSYLQYINHSFNQNLVKYAIWQILERYGDEDKINDALYAIGMDRAYYDPTFDDIVLVYSNGNIQRLTYDTKNHLWGDDNLAYTSISQWLADVFTDNVPDPIPDPDEVPPLPPDPIPIIPQPQPVIPQPPSQTPNRFVQAASKIPHPIWGAVIDPDTAGQTLTYQQRQSISRDKSWIEKNWWWLLLIILGIIILIYFSRDKKQQRRFKKFFKATGKAARKSFK